MNKLVASRNVREGKFLKDRFLGWRRWFSTYVFEVGPVGLCDWTLPGGEKFHREFTADRWAAYPDMSAYADNYKLLEN